MTRGDRVDVFEDDLGEYHFVVFPTGVPNARRDAQTLCGRAPTSMRLGAFFRVGDRRGAVHFSRACRSCGSALVV
jgi:hypothetical protein